MQHRQPLPQPVPGHAASLHMKHSPHGHGRQHLVGGLHHPVRPAGQSRHRHPGMQPEMRPMSLIHQKRQPGQMRHPGIKLQIPTHSVIVGVGQEHRLRLGIPLQRCLKSAKRHSAGNPRRPVHLRLQHHRPGTGQHQGMDHRFMGVALHQDQLLRLADSADQGQIACRAAAHQKKRLLRAEAFRSQPLGFQNRPLRVVQIIHSLYFRIINLHHGAEERSFLPLQTGAKLMARHMEAGFPPPAPFYQRLKQWGSLLIHS
ncbi:hypothetical protein D3C75_691690 [compost metagenome]